MKQVPLTVGMAVFDDFDGVYFTVQAMRMYHRDVKELTIVVVDNNPDSASGQATMKFCTEARVIYLPFTDQVSTFVKREIFKAAPSEYVLCIDCHVLLEPGALRRLAEYYAKHRDSIDLHQGPILSDDLNTLHTHMDPVWSGGHFGKWGIDERGHKQTIEIEATGMGLFSCRRSVLPEFHQDLRGFGGEEFYVHDKVRAAGGKCLCHPWLKWVHRFGRPNGVPYPLSHEAILRNYLIEWREIGRDPQEVLKHYEEFLGPAVVGGMVVCGGVT